MNTVRRTIWSAAACGVAVAVLLIVGGNRTAACPFCAAASQTLSEEQQSADVVVLAKLVHEASPSDPSVDGDDQPDPTAGNAKFSVQQVLRGENVVQPGQEIEVVYFGPADREQMFLITGIGTDKVDWITPLPLSPAAVEYTRRLQGVPPAGADRLAFFQEYLEHDDPLLAQDAYDEFSRSPYADLLALGPRMHHDRLVKWISDPEVSPSRRRLYFTMLGVCGTKDDVPLLEDLIKSDIAAKQPFLEQLVRASLSLGGPAALPTWIELVKLDERRKKLGLDALVACYLTLQGGEGLELIDKQFLKNPAAEYTYIYSTVMALRFHGDEATSSVPRERLLASMRLLLDNPDFADQVPIDLARWKDWSVLDRLVDMFKTSQKDAYIRQPVVSYLTVASDEEGSVGMRAKAALAELEQLDPDGVKQAQSLAAFGALARSRPSAAAASPSATGGMATAEGFAATEADRQAAEETDPADIPEPSQFDGRAQAQPAAEPRATAPDVRPTARNSAGQEASARASTSATAPPVTGPLPATEADRWLIVGVPVVAAVLLAGLYWAILRVGAV